MKKTAAYFDRDFWHHLILIIVLTLGIILFYFFSFSRLFRFTIGFSLAVFYVLWGIIHHKLDGDLHFKNVVEYIFIALLAVVILGGMLI